MNVQPGYTFEAVVDTGQTGLLSTLGVEVSDNVGGLPIAFTTSGISEIAPGVYSTASLTAPGAEGQYTIVWRLGATGEVLAVEDLVVSLIAIKPLGAPPTSVGFGMSGSALITEFLADKRFGTTRTRVLGFLNARYGELLALEEWAFLQVTAPITLDAPIVTGPLDLGLIHSLYLNDTGQALAYIEIDPFEQRYPDDGTTGRPEAFTMYGGNLRIAPEPDAAYAATIDYQSDPPPLGDDAYSPVTPWWSHEGLVAGAQAYALLLENDPTGNPLEARYQATIDAMRRRYLVSGRAPSQQMPRDPLLR